MDIHLNLLKNIYKIIKRLHNRSVITKRREILRKIEEGQGVDKELDQVNDTEMVQEISENYTGIHNSRKNKLFMREQIGRKMLNSIFVLSSHNSYLTNYQNFDFTDTEVIIFLLKIGVRCLEFDVYYKDGALVVGHGTKNIFHDYTVDLDVLTTNVISLEEIFKIIREYAFGEFSDLPLFINLELLTRGNEQAHIWICNLISKYFSEHLLKEAFFYGGRNLGECRVAELRNKIVFISGRKLGNMDPLKKYINGYTYMISDILRLINVSHLSHVDRDGVDLDRVISPKFILNLSSAEVENEVVQKIVRNHIARRGLVRVFPCPGIYTSFSRNFDFGRSMDLGVQFVSLNIQQLNHGVEAYLEKFNGSPLLEIIESDRNKKN